MISVIVVNYHSALLTQRAVSSVMSEDDETEILVVDNTAEPEEQAVLRSLLPEGVRTILNESNEGFARACNKAYAASSGEFVLLLNPDAFFLPGGVRRLREFLLNNPSAGAAGPRIYWDADRTFLLPPSLFPSPMNELWRQAGRRLPGLSRLHSLVHRSRSVKTWKTADPLAQTALSGGHVMLRREALERCGGLFDDSFFMYYEDSDLMLRLRKGGYGLFVEPTSEVVHSYAHDNAKASLMKASEGFYFQKNFSKSIVLGMTGWIGRMPCHESTNRGVFAGKFCSPLSLTFPEGGPDPWLFEWSPSQDLIPSVGRFGTGRELRFPGDLWDLLAPGTYYSRISSAKPYTCRSSYLFWEKS